MIEQFVKYLTSEQAQQVLIDCLEKLQELEIIEVLGMPSQEEDEIDFYWTNSGDPVLTTEADF